MSRGIEYEADDELRVMRRAGLVVAELHREVREAAVPGATTNDLDEVAAGVIAKNGATPNFLGYYGFPKTICTSVNEEVVHGIPADRVLREGDRLSADPDPVDDGWHGSAACARVIGTGSAQDGELSAAPPRTTWQGK